MISNSKANDVLNVIVIKNANTKFGVGQQAKVGSGAMEE
jgi:hypothetical protein